MKISYQQLQEYFEKPLPKPEVLAEALSMHVWEVDGMEEKDGDSIFDIKVLPDRASYGNSPIGVAREISAILKLELKDKGDTSDNQTKVKHSQEIEVSVYFINHKLGVVLSEKEVVNFLESQDIKVSKVGENLRVTAPSWRNDLNIAEDIPEEVGRLYGYSKILPTLPPADESQILINKVFYYENKIRIFLQNLGFSEIYTSTFRKKGDLEVLKPVASDKSHLRNDLSTAMNESLEFNFHNADYLGLKQIRLFEIGRVFAGGFEQSDLCIGILNKKGIKKKVNEEIREIREALLVELSVNIQTVCTIDDSGGLIVLHGKQIGVINVMNGILEFDLGKVIEVLPEPSVSKLDSEVREASTYKPFSRFPFIVRDVAFFAENKEADFESILTAGLDNMEKRLIVKGPNLFDRFVKGGKLSLAYRFIFQAFDRTLTDEDVRVIMDKIYQSIKNKDWDVR